MIRVSLDDDKYTVERSEGGEEFRFRALRYGKPWMDSLYLLQGGNLFYWLTVELDEAREEKRALKAENEKLKKQINRLE